MSLFVRIKSKISIVYRILISVFPSRRTQSYDLTIVRCDLLGDFIMKYDSLIEIQKFFQGKRVLIVCPTFVVPFIEGIPFFTRIVGYDMKKMDNLSYLTNLSRELKRIRSTIVYYCSWERYLQGDTITSFIQSNNRVAMRGSHSGGIVKHYYDSKYNKLVEFPQRGSEIRALEAFVRGTYNSDYHYGKNPLVLSVPYTLNLRSPYIVVSISSSMEEKTWPINCFVHLINEIPEQYTIVISGAGEKDVEKAHYIIETSFKKNKIVNMVNKTNVLELVGLISKCELLIGNDSAAVHIAAAIRVPSVCILHGAHYGRFLPYPEDSLEGRYLPKIVCHHMDCYYCEYKCIYDERNPFRCLKNVSVKDVCDAVNEVLESNC